MDDKSQNICLRNAPQSSLDFRLNSSFLNFCRRIGMICYTHNILVKYISKLMRNSGTPGVFVFPLYMNHPKNFTPKPQPNKQTPKRSHGVKLQDTTLQIHDN